jgi:metallophosphoesterase (TIGR03768 family)
MSILRRDFLKYCAGSAAALGLEFSSLGPLGREVLAGGFFPTYPISKDVQTTLDRTVIASGSPVLGPNATVLPYQLSLYTQRGYGEWAQDPAGIPAGPAYPYCTINMNTGDATSPSAPDPSAVTLLSFFTMSDVHICDKESPAQSFCNSYQYPNPYPSLPPSNEPAGDISSYSGVILYTTQVLDAAIQTVNALHKKARFDFGIALGDACDNTQYNELRWYLGVIDGGPITPSSGAHKGAGKIRYQKPYMAAGLDKSIQWYQAIGNHDQFWKGSTFWTEHLRETVVGSSVLNMGPQTTSPPNLPVMMNGSGFMAGVVDGSTEYGNIIDVGQVTTYNQPKPVAADPNRRALTVSQWMSQFFNTTSKPAGHGFTQEMVNGTSLAACYTFYPKANMPIKVIVLDDTDKMDCSPYGCLDAPRYNWLINELESGQAADEFMIICSHIPVWADGYQSPDSDPPHTFWNPDSYVSDQELVATINSTYSNVVLWIAGHVHRNAITPQAANSQAQSGDPDYGWGFWEVETPSLRDFPQEFRRFEIVLNSDLETISILVIDVDPAVNPASLPDGSQSPAFISRTYSIGAQQIFNIPIWQPLWQSPDMDSPSGVCNAQLFIQLSQLTPGLQAELRSFSG